MITRERFFEVIGESDFGKWRTLCEAALDGSPDDLLALMQGLYYSGRNDLRAEKQREVMDSLRVAQVEFETWREVEGAESQSSPDPKAWGNSVGEEEEVPSWADPSLRVKQRVKAECGHFLEIETWPVKEMDGYVARGVHDAAKYAAAVVRHRRDGCVSVTVVTEGRG